MPEIMINSPQTLQVNRFARRIRHLKNFSRLYLLRKYLLLPAIALANKTPFKEFFHFVLFIGRFLVGALPIAPQKRLLLQAGIIGVVTIFITALTPVTTYSVSTVNYENSELSTLSLSGDILLSDENGYLVKINPQTSSSSRIGMTDFAVHTVESGETLSVIAGHYGVNVSTVMWENNIANANNLRVGQKLMVPPVDGISYKVQKGDTLDKIAEKYKVSSESIIAQNTLASDSVVIGQNLFLPQAEPLNQTILVQGNARTGTVTRDVRGYSTAPSTATPAVGKILIFPTIGNITQGYHAGHYAIDIGNRSMPPIWAAASGTVIEASSGWNGGYGNKVVIDHGNGFQTLYAHLNTIDVTVGDWVNQGDGIGQMGNTGRVYGATGIHLHLECIVGGIKEYCPNYY